MHSACLVRKYIAEIGIGTGLGCEQATTQFKLLTTVDTMWRGWLVLPVPPYECAVVIPAGAFAGNCYDTKFKEGM